MEYAAVFLAGIALGCFYFGGLWLTTRSVARAPLGHVQQRHSFLPALKMFLSFIGRMGVTLAGLYWLMQENWIRALVALLGILLARFVIKYWVGSVVRKEVSG